MLPRNPPNPDSYVRFASHLQRKHTDQLGFLPTVAIKEYAQRGQILLAHQNDQPCAYAIYFDGRNGNRPRFDPLTIRIHQLCTQEDARRILHATHLVNQIYDIAKTGHFTAIRAWVAHDIPANEFWHAVGFNIHATRQGGRRRNRLHNLWILNLE